MLLDSVLLNSDTDRLLGGMLPTDALDMTEARNHRFACSTVTRIVVAHTPTGYQYV